MPLRTLRADPIPERITSIEEESEVLPDKTPFTGSSMASTFLDPSKEMGTERESL